MISRKGLKISTAVFFTLTVVLATLLLLVVDRQQQRSDRQPSNIERLNPGMIAQQADSLLKITDAKVVVLWSADMQINARTVLYMHDTKGPVGQLIGYNDQIYSSDNVMNVFMTPLMDGKLNCGQVNTSSKVGQYVAAVGAPSICRRGILVDGLLIGYISLSYPKSPSDEEVLRLNSMLDKIVGDVLVKRK